MVDRWQSTPIKCTGGLVLNQDALTQGSLLMGSARVLQNFEPSLDGGYRRINGYTTFDSTIVPGTGTNPVLGVCVAIGGVYAVRKLVNDNAIYFSSGTGWSAKLNAGARNGAVTKARGIAYAFTAPVVVLTDGVNYAWKHNGAAETVINGVGAPTNPKYAAAFVNRLILAGYSSNTAAISISAPNADTDFTGASGAIEISVGDEITGLMTFREVLYIFCKHSIKKLVGSSATDFAIQNVTLKVGCIGHDTIREIGGDLIYLATDGFRSLAATERIGDLELGLVSTQIQSLVSPFLGQALAEYQFSSCVIYKKSQYRVFINNTSYTETDNINFIGKFEGRAATSTTSNATALSYEWATLVGIKPYSVDSGFENGQEYSVFGHPTSGYVYRMEQGNSFNGTAINALYRTPDITFISDKTDTTMRKVFQKLTIYSQVEGDLMFSASLKIDREGSNILQPAAIALSQTGTTVTYGAAIYGTSAYGSLAYPVFYTNLIGSGVTGAFVFSCTDTSAPFKIDSFTVQLAAKGQR